MRATAQFTFCFAGLFLLAAPANAVSVTNGDFETGDFTGWSNGAGATIVSGGAALAGSFSAELPGVSGGGAVAQSFTPTTEVVQTSFLFAMGDPGGSSNRGLNAFWRESAGSGQINLRVVDVDNDGDGDVQVYDGSWQTVLPDSVSFSTTNSLSLRLNEYGGSANYDLNVNGDIAAGLSFFQNQVIDDFDEIQFSNQFGVSAFTVDNFTAAEVVAIPEPATGGLVLLSLVGLAFARRRR